MTGEIILFLILSVTLSAGRNITSKKTAISLQKKSDFYFSQTVLFGSASALLLLFVLASHIKISLITFAFSIIYSALLILSQWMFTKALKNGNVAVCSVLYSLGFILPTLSGALFWGESFTIRNAIGVVLAIIVILFSAKKDNSVKQGKKTYIPYIITAMLSSGGLGIMQKVQSTLGLPDEKGIFLFTAFIIAFLASIAAYLACKEKEKPKIRASVPSALTGLCFGGANLFNTILAGKMSSAVFFPLQNISTIMITTLIGILLFKEKITFKTATILFLATVIIVLFSA